MFECFAALALLELGYPDQSDERLARGLTLARELGHPQTLTVALHVSAQPYQLLGEPSLVYEPAKDALALADEYGFAVWRAHGLIERGWALAELGSPQDGIEMMKKGLAEYEATGAKLRSPYFLGLLADQLGKTGRVVEGLTVITDAITLAQNTGEGYGLPELHRIKLFLKSRDLSQSAKLLSDSPALETVSQARACFAETLHTSKQQGRDGGN